MTHVVKVRAYCFTGNYDSEEKKEQLVGIIESMQRSTCTYYCYGEEVAPTTGQLHLQGYIRFKNAKRLSTLIKEMPGFHLEPAKGSCTANIQYTSKTRDVDENAGKTPGDVENGCQPWFEWGERVEEGAHLKGWLYTLQSIRDDLFRDSRNEDVKIVDDLCEEIFDFFLDFFPEIFDEDEFEEECSLETINEDDDLMCDPENHYSTSVVSKKRKLT